MGQFAEQLGMQAASTATGGLFGMLLGGYNDERQLRQEQDLQRLHIAGSKEMTDYNMAKQLEMWKATSYRAQLEEMKKAGLSPGLMYGMKGGGGVTTGTPSGGMGNAGAPAGGREIQDMMGMGLQLELLKAQKEVMATQAEKNRAEAEKISGVDTEESKSRISLNVEGVSNTRAKTVLLDIQRELGELDVNLKDRTLEAQVRTIENYSDMLNSKMQSLRYQTNIDEATWTTKVEQIKADLFGTWLRNALVKAETNKTEVEITDIVRRGIQRWKELELMGRSTEDRNRNMKHDEWINDMQKSTGIPMEILREAVDGIFRNGSRGIKHTYKEGEDSRGRYWEKSENW